MTTLTGININAMSHILGDSKSMGRSAHEGIRTTVGRLGCVPGTCTHKLGVGGAGAITLVVPAV